jgi:hypothetical protein
MQFYLLIIMFYKRIIFKNKFRFITGMKRLSWLQFVKILIFLIILLQVFLGLKINNLNIFL